MKRLITDSIVIFFALTCFASNERLLYTGNVTGLYYTIGTKLCNILHCFVKTSKGSIENINKLNNAPNSLAIIQSDILNEHLGQFTPLLTLYEESYSLVVRADSKIHTFKDLQGKTVNIGKTGSGAHYAIKNLLKLYQMDISDFKKTSYLPVNIQGQALCKGLIDAALYVTGHPNSNLQEASNNCELKILPLNDQLSKDLIAQNNFFISSKIKANTYPGNHEDIYTIGVKAMLVGSKNLSPDYRQEITELETKLKSITKP